jgi:hypothetical protein
MLSNHKFLGKNKIPVFWQAPYSTNGSPADVLLLSKADLKCINLIYQKKCTIKHWSS